MHDPRVSALLRLKRHEQPPPGYFDQLLADVHRRQRAELLRRPLWKIAIERTQVFFSEHSMGHLSYAGAMAAVLVVGVAAIGLMTPGASGPAARQLAETRVEPNLPPVAAAPVAEISTAPAANRMLVLGPAQQGQPNGDATFAPLLETRRPSAPQIVAPRYIIDARPVSYERASSF